MGLLSLSLITPFIKPPNFSQLHIHLTKRKVSNAFSLLAIPQQPWSQTALLSPPSWACKRFGCSAGAFASRLPNFLPLTEGLTQAITHQVPAAVAQVSMAAAVRRQQWDGKVRNFLNIGSSIAEFSDRFLHTDSALQSQLLLKNLCYCSGIFWRSTKQTQQGERDHTCARRTWFLFVFKA